MVKNNFSMGNLVSGVDFNFSWSARQFGVIKKTIIIVKFGNNILYPVINYVYLLKIYSWRSHDL